MKTKITFWGGLDTIGGNIAEVTYGNDRVIFDFGLVYNPASAMLDTKERSTDKHVLDLLKLHAIPAIDGIYSEKDLSAGPNYCIETPQSEEDSDFQTGVFISHLHLDHMGAMDTIASGIPVYMTEESHRLFHTLEKVGEGLTIKRKYESIHFREKVSIGQITVSAFPVDHDVIGAASFLIETPDEIILYSGDLRMHGAHSEYIEAWLNQMKKKEISLLLIEGTSFRPETDRLNVPGTTKRKQAAEKQAVNISSVQKEHIPLHASSCQSEADIEQAATALLEETTGLALFNIYHRNVERIQQFLDAAKKTRRIAVLEWETACIADEFLEAGEFMIYLDKAESLSPSFHKLINQHGGITPEQINQSPAHYLLQNSFHQIHRLLDLNVNDSIYLHANGMPLGPYDPAYDTMHMILKHFQVTYQSLDVSGHASKEDILYIINQINPKAVVPWHSIHPELVQPMNDAIEVLLPEKYRPYSVEDGKVR